MRTTTAALVAAFLLAAPATVLAADADQPAAFASWDPEVYEWGGKSTLGAMIFGGVSFGLLIAGDQLSRGLAIEHGSVGRPAVMSNLTFVDHIPRGPGDELDAGRVAKSYVFEYLFVVGMQGVVPVFAGSIPGLIAAGSGADLQTVKTVSCFVGGGSLLGTGIALLSRFHRLYRPQWELHQQDELGIAFVVPGVINLAAGIADAAVAGVTLVWGVHRQSV